MGSVCCCFHGKDPEDEDDDDDEAVPVSTRPVIMEEVVGGLRYVYASSEEDVDEGHGRDDISLWWSWNFCNGKPNTLYKNLI